MDLDVDFMAGLMPTQASVFDPYGSSGDKAVGQSRGCWKCSRCLGKFRDATACPRVAGLWGPVLMSRVRNPAKGTASSGVLGRFVNMHQKGLLDIVETLLPFNDEHGFIIDTIRLACLS